MKQLKFACTGLFGFALLVQPYGYGSDFVSQPSSEVSSEEETNEETTQVSYRAYDDELSSCQQGCANNCSTGCGTCGSGCGHSSLIDDIFACTDDWKNIPCGDPCDPWSVGFGGAIRFRHINEDNRLRPGGPDQSTYDQWRWQNWIEIKKDDSFTAHFEFIDASTFNEDMAPLAIDVNRMDILRAYVDFKVLELDSRSYYLKFGRQFLKYGSQHLVSPLAWANTYRTFEGFKLYSNGDNWDISAFATRPVTEVNNLYHPTSPDHGDQSRTFSGVYLTNHSLENNVFDFYWLYLDEQEQKTNVMDGRRHTIGMRWEGKRPVKDACGEVSRLWFWDFEGAYQFGEDANSLGQESDVNAGFFSAVVGHTWKKVTWSPTIKGLYYWGSGDDDPASGDVTTVSTLFPLGHAYWGLIDNFSGQNLIDYSVQASVQPTKKLNLMAAIHWFNAANGNDFVYNVAGAALPSGAGSNYGQELDLVATYVFNKNMNLQAGYFWNWYGAGIVDGPLRRDDAQMFYIMQTITY